MGTMTAPKPKGKTSDLAKREARLAYYLLAPTFIILFLIAFYPLGSVFYNSMTDRTFASGREPEFVGLDNYANLLSLTIRELPPQVDEAGNTVINPDTGEVVYETAVRMLPREPRRYRELSQFSLFGNRYVVGATDVNFIRSIGDTLRFTVLSVSIETILGIGIALVVNSKFPGRGLMRVFMLVCWVCLVTVYPQKSNVANGKNGDDEEDDHTAGVEGRSGRVAGAFYGGAVDDVVEVGVAGDFEQVAYGSRVAPGEGGHGGNVGGPIGGGLQHGRGGDAAEQVELYGGGVGAGGRHADDVDGVAARRCPAGVADGELAGAGWGNGVSGEYGRGPRRVALHAQSYRIVVAQDGINVHVEQGITGHTNILPPWCHT